MPMMNETLSALARLVDQKKGLNKLILDNAKDMRGELSETVIERLSAVSKHLKELKVWGMTKLEHKAHLSVLTLVASIIDSQDGDMHLESLSLKDMDVETRFN